MRAPHLAFMLLINVIWGFNVVPMKLAVEQLPPITATTVRFLMLLVICAPAIRWAPGRMASIVLVALIGGALMFSLNMVSFGLADDVSALAIAGQLGVPFSLILAILFLGERIRFIRTIGIVLSFTGVVILSFDPHIFDQRLALLLSVIASFCYAISTILMRQMRGVGPLQLQGWVAMISLVPMIGLSLLYEPGALAALPKAPPMVFAYLLFSAVGASIVGHAGMYWLLQRYPVSLTAPYTLLSPLIAVIFSVWLLGSALTGQMIVGGVLALIGVAIITLRSAHKASSGNEPKQ